MPLSQSEFTFPVEEGAGQFTELAAVYHNAEPVLGPGEIEAVLDTMAKALAPRLRDKNPVVLCLVNGGILLTGHLLPRMAYPLTLDYLHITRYNNQLEGGEVAVIAQPKSTLAGRDVLLLDDILDGGLTLSAAVHFCQRAGAERIHTAVLLDKTAARVPGGLPVADVTGCAIENGYVFGFGLDYQGYFRNLPGIYRANETGAP